MELLKTYYCPQTMEIAEHFKFFKHTQETGERTINFMAALRYLAKTCNFGMYLETTLCDQFVCGLHDEKCQQELLSIQNLTAAITLQKATAAEAVSKETQAMQETTTGSITNAEVSKLLSKAKYYCCGKSGHHPSNCKFKSAKCYSCQKVGHLASVCQNKKPMKSGKPMRLQKKSREFTVYKKRMDLVLTVLNLNIYILYCSWEQS